MGHHKRRKPKYKRSGCLWCKPHKGNHAKHQERDKPSDRRRMQTTKEE